MTDLQYLHFLHLNAKIGWIFGGIAVVGYIICVILEPRKKKNDNS